MGKFADAIAEFAEKAKKNLNLTQREATLGVAAELVNRSPVGDPSYWQSKPPKGYIPGHFKANWQGGDGYVNTTVTDDVDPTGEVSMISISSKIPDKFDGTPFYITNSLPYAHQLENGWSRQAPAGIVGITRMEWQDIVKAAVTRAELGLTIR